MKQMKVWMLAALAAGAWLGAVARAQDDGSIVAQGSYSSREVDVELDATADPIWTDDVAPDEWCGAYQRYVAGLTERGMNPLAAFCAENGPCDDPVDRNAAIPTVDTLIKTYRLSFHVFCNNDGSNCAATQADVDNAVVELNTRYEPWRIQFVYQTNFINSTTYRTLSPNSEEVGMKNAYADSPATKLNVYVVNTTGGLCWGTFPFDPDALGSQGGVVMHETWFRMDSQLPYILTHEVGHCLGLWHTHHGVSEVPQCGDCYEAAGRSPAEGDITGDRCSDTNPTPSNSGCFDPPGPDPCSGNPWVSTPYLNYMGYSNVCPIEFTDQQAGRMHCWTTDVLTGWLDLPMPPAAPGTPTLTKIGGGQIRVAWADNSMNEDGFRVQREKKSGSNWIQTQIIADVGANITSVTNAPGSGTFRYRVQAYNGLGDSAWSAWRQIKN